MEKECKELGVRMTAMERRRGSGCEAQRIMTNSWCWRRAQRNRQRWLPRKLEIKQWSPCGQHQIYGFAADVQNQFDWSACEEGQKHFDKERMIHV